MESLYVTNKREKENVFFFLHLLNLDALLVPATFKRRAVSSSTEKTRLTRTKVSRTVIEKNYSALFDRTPRVAFFSLSLLFFICCCFFFSFSLFQGGSCNLVYNVVVSFRVHWADGKGREERTVKEK